MQATRPNSAVTLPVLTNPPTLELMYYNLQAKLVFPDEPSMRACWEKFKQTSSSKRFEWIIDSIKPSEVKLFQPGDIIDIKSLKTMLREIYGEHQYQ